MKTRNKRLKSSIRSFTILLTSTLLAFLFGCSENKVDSKSLFGNATYIGSEKCASCHKQEYDLYKNSDHDLAMKHADSTTILGDFNNSAFTHFGITSKFYKKDDRYFVFTEDQNGEMKEFRVNYTFGYFPLQQYLIEFNNGRIQCLPLCWDTRPKSEGGQKWFHIYGNEKITHKDILHWTRVNQNWNYMCADCHSTNLKKNYDPVKNDYKTTWSEINVGCEACHGPGSLHEEWAKKKEIYADILYPNKGLTKIFDKPADRNWLMNNSTGIAELQESKRNDNQIETCAPCHSHRSKINDDIKPNESFLDNYIPSLLDESLYFDDGQIKEEVYVYGSFLQSKMYHAGVVCSDCHQSHSTKVFSKGDEQCFKCHLPDKFANNSHHRHKKESEGARCVNCHMPTRTYMQIDKRRDHSFRIPRPDLTERIGVPNACNQCHEDKSNTWAVDNYENWYGKKEETHFGEIFYSARKGDPEVYNKLIALIENENLSAIVRATAISLLANYPKENSAEIITKYSQHPEILIRLSAVATSGMLPPEHRSFLFENLSDSIKSVVITAAQNLANIPTQNLSLEQKELLEKSLKGYVHSQEINSDHPSARINLGYFYFASGNFNESEQQYKKAIELEPLFSPAYINLSDLYRETKRDSLGKEILLNGLKLIPEDASLNFSLALLEIRNGNKTEGLNLLKKAATNDPGNSYYRYVYEIAKK
jgi:tetratricopeptide (TPR) repeat protein